MKAFRIIILIVLCVPVSILVFDIYNYFDPTNFENNIDVIIRHFVISIIILIIYFIVPLLFRIKYKSINLNFSRGFNTLANNWFKIVISFFLVGVLYLGWEYVQAQKEIAKNGRYQISTYYGIDTRTGVIYMNGSTKEEIPK